MSAATMLASPPGQNEALHDGTALVAALIALSPYRAVLAPMTADIARVAQANHQIRAALRAVEARSAFARTGRLRRADLGPDRETLWAFLEHVRFASPAFLRSVGEWPVGGARG